MRESDCSTAMQRREIMEQGVSENQPKAMGEYFRPLLDLYDFQDHYEIRVELPGADRESIDVTILDSMLTIAANVPDRYPVGVTLLMEEYGVGDFRRQIRLGEDIDVDALDAKYEYGVLTLVLPRQSQRKPRRIEIRSV